ncbi:MAG TPA: hypothetical protein VNJ01_01345 [Bacteriovoracaceae bacterium]|nr:hypothetical protein [Bacteriovoracaceae bacterium]
MLLPTQFSHALEWTVVGPMGPMVPDILISHPRLAVDGGAHFCSGMDVWVGDADSYQIPVQCPHIFKLEKEKDNSDLAAALSLLTTGGGYRLHLWGFLGGRRDHELFNLGEVSTFLKGKEESQVWMYQQDGKAIFIYYGPGRRIFTHHGLFSLGTLEEISVELSGHCRYQITKPHTLPPLSSFGLSNFASGEVCLESSGPCFIFFPEGR